MTPWELSHCPIVISQVTRGLARMLSGGACWSLWERLGVWTTLTARASGALIIQLNPDRADGARRACASTYAIDIHEGKQKHERAENTHGGAGGGARLRRAQLPPSVVPVAGDLGHTAVSSDGHTDGKREKHWKG